MPLIVVFALGFGALVIFTGMYNGLVHLRVRSESAWSDIDVQLKRRHDLVPNLVETVKGYAAHEKSTFDDVARYRTMAMQASNPGERAQAEDQLTTALQGLLAVSESYPQLRASEQFMSLQNSLGSVEEAVQNARRYYNAVVRDYNTTIQSFPMNVVASIFRFHTRQFFEVDQAAERESVVVRF
ncbi:MAG TPA: LemA family protein [Candidatus Angelobacter sp.]|jgi:LemA protein|nr:LemA family protein [Candidatus Angelobacter sp.]